MELNLASTITHNINSSRNSCGQLVEGFNPRVQLRETRSAYFINVNLSGFRKEDIRLEMDNTRTLIIRGQRYLQGMGKVEWTWHLMESGGRSFRKPFKIPHNVNVGATTGSFHQGVLHVLMPKFRWTSRFTPYHFNRSDLEDPEAAHQTDISNVVQEEAKENGGSHDIEENDDFMRTQSNAAKEADDDVAEKIDGLVGTQSNTPKDGHVGTESNTPKEADSDVAQKKDDIVETRRNATKEEDDDVAKTMDDLVETQTNTTKEADDGVAQNVDDFVDTQSNEAKEADAQKSPATSTVEEKSIPQQSSMCLPTDCSSAIDTHLQQENNEAATSACDNIEGRPLQQHVTAADVDHEEPSSLCSKDDQVGHNEEDQINGLQDMGTPTYEKEKDDEHTQKKDDSRPPNKQEEEGSIARQEAACSLNLEVLDEDNHENHEPENMKFSDVNDEYSGIISYWKNGEAWWSRRKIVVSVFVSSVVIIAAFKLMRRR